MRREREVTDLSGEWDDEEWTANLPKPDFSVLDQEPNWFDEHAVDLPAGPRPVKTIRPIPILQRPLRVQGPNLFFIDGPGRKRFFLVEAQFPRGPVYDKIGLIDQLFDQFLKTQSEKLNMTRANLYEQLSLVRKNEAAGWNDEYSALEEEIEALPTTIPWLGSRQIYSAYWMAMMLQDQINLYWFLNVDVRGSVVSYTEDPIDSVVQSRMTEEQGSLIHVTKELRQDAIKVIQMLELAFKNLDFEVYHQAITVLDLYLSQCRRVPQKKPWLRLATASIYFMVLSFDSNMTEEVNRLFFNSSTREVRGYVFHRDPWNMSAEFADRAYSEYAIQHRQVFNTIYHAFRNISMTQIDPLLRIPVSFETDIPMGMDVVMTPLTFLRRIQRFLQLGPDLAGNALLPVWKPALRQRIGFLAEYYLMFARLYDDLLSCYFNEISDACVYLAILVLVEHKKDAVLSAQTIWNTYFSPYTITKFSSHARHAGFLFTVGQLHANLRRHEAEIRQSTLFEVYSRESYGAVAAERIPEQALTDEQNAVE